MRLLAAAGMAVVVVRMIVTIIVAMIVLMVAGVIVRVLVDGELRRRHPGAHDAGRVDVRVAERERSQRARQRVERHPGVEERAERHVPREARETVEVQNPRH